MLNSGRPLFRLHDMGQEIPEGDKTLGEVLRENGYDTYGIGKWHNGAASYTRSFSDGKNIFFGGMWDHWNVPICDYRADGDYSKLLKRHTLNFGWSNEVSFSICDRIEAGKHSSELMREAAVSYIENHDGGKPFYMYVSFLAPHDPRTMPDKFRNMYDPDDIRLPESFAEKHEIDYGLCDGTERDERLAPTPRTKKDIKRHIAEYYAMISHLDDNVGQIMDAAVKKGIADDTIFVFAADNGLAVGCHGLMGKQNLYEHSIRVPLIISGRGIPKNLRKNEYVYLHDLYPTLCDLSGSKIPKTVESKSLVDVINGGAGYETLYFAYENKIRSVKDGRFKLMEYRHGNTKATQLFDLQNDPEELRNLGGDPKYAGEIKRLRALMLQCRDFHDDAAHRCSAGYWENF